MALSFSVTPGYSFSDSEKVTYSKLNLLGSPVITLDGQAESGEIADGSITTAKLASTIDINSKIADHNIDLTKLASGTHGQVLYYDSNGDLVTLNPGTAGNFLKTNGTGADPEWAAQAGVSTVNISQIVTSGADKYISTDSSGNIQWEAKPGAISVATVWHQESTNTAAEASTTSASARKVTNKTDPDGIVTLGGTSFALEDGTYVIDGLVSYDSAAQNTTAWLYDTTGSSILVYGGAAVTQASNAESGWLPLKGRFTLSSGGANTLEIRQIAGAAVTGGFGKAANLGQPEVYTTFTLWKIA